MNVTEARGAFLAAVEEIAAKATDNGFTSEVKCFIADHDLCVIEDENAETATIIAAELSLGADGVDEKVVYECAIGITEGEVSSDEMASEISSLRKNVKELIEKTQELGGASQAITDSFKEQDKPGSTEARVFDNKSFYIGTAAVAAVIILILLLFKAL